MIDPQTITEAKRALGRQLAALREAAGKTQQQLAHQINYGRSTIANAETGYSTCRRTFWEHADKALHADGALLAGYDELRALISTQRVQVAELTTAKRAAAFRELQDRQVGEAHEVDVIAGSTSQSRGATSSANGALGDPDRDGVVLRLRLDGKVIAVPLSRRLLLQAGIGTFVEALALGQQFDILHDIMTQRRPVDRLVITSPAHLRETVTHLREQWHALVKTDNLLGPRFALAGVLNQVTVVEAVRSVLRDKQRLEVVRLGAQYAESAAWLYEDTGNLAQARYWTSRAMEWAYEGDDERMLAWTIFRRSQQAAAVPDAAQVIALTRAARRKEEQLATPTRAAIRVQEAYGHALDGDEHASQQLLDEAHAWAASDTVGDAHEGHGSYCTPSYIEIQRATCWLTTGRTKKAIALYEEGLRTLPAVYQRNRAAALSRLAMAYVADGQIEQAASTAHAALPVARSAGSRRIVEEIKSVGTGLAPHRPLGGVAALLDDLGREDA
jgi:transcriptional regulator with XRE-family HTH domain